MTQAELRDKLNILHLVWGSWKNVATQLGVSQATVYRWKSGEQPVPRYIWMISEWVRFSGILIEDDSIQ